MFPYINFSRAGHLPRLLSFVLMQTLSRLYVLLFLDVIFPVILLVEDIFSKRQPPSQVPAGEYHLVAIAAGGSSELLFLPAQLDVTVNSPSLNVEFLQLPDYDITMEAAWPELFVDQNGGYWNVPESVSLDLSSIVSESGLRYRNSFRIWIEVPFGLQNVSGQPQPLSDSTIGEPHLNLMPRLCAKAGFSYEKSRDIWRQKETKDDLTRKTDQCAFLVAIL
ncbi:hypothetical protein MKX01_016509 [Papaver californicum]|nr:hypothetical protein MKX01_016509 [Papaver californicum]